jgi:hypothetical protein
VQFAGHPVAADVSAGRWVADAVQGLPPDTVGSLVTPRFAAVARVFHPAARYDEDDDVEVRWSAVAGANGTTAHPLMQWGSVTGSMDYFENDDQAPLWHGAPARGHLPASLAARLVRLLAAHTGTPQDCWFGVADGGTVSSDAASLEVAGHRYWLVRGPIALATANMAAEPFEQGANLWWPDDRSWLVATGVDLVSTYVAGSADCIAGVLSDEGLESAPADAAQRVTWDADRINPLPADGPSAPHGG